MDTIRMRATAEADGELHLRGLSIQRGQVAEVIILADGSTDDALLAVLKHDPAWSWLQDPSEDVYTEEDVR